MSLISIALLSAAIQPSQPVVSTGALAASHIVAKPGDVVTLVYTITPKEGWHTYWSNPGDSGMAPKFEWKVQKGIEISEPKFPAPSVHQDDTGLGFIYHGPLNVVFQAKISDQAPKGKFQIEAKGSWLVCMNSCLPGGATSKLEIEVATESKPSEKSPAIEEMAKALPPAAKQISAKFEGKQLTIQWKPEKSVTKPVFMSAIEGAFDYNSQDWKLQPDGSWVGTVKLTEFAPEKVTAKGFLSELDDDGNPKPGYTFELVP